ncbi:glycoside hydrolase [Chitinophaga vietnamensis]|uniref:glycoside hydrolase n=1 Tax=Chitinophaga vietnamensis TaxID=2593957 RepID=UPI00191BF01C|nr:glycoside hydrolase [Chitinophaga vietnamensis]
MKKNLTSFCFPVLAAMLASSCSKNLQSEALKANASQLAAGATAAAVTIDTANITLNWGTVYQRIEGFGAFAGRATPFFESNQRDSIMKQLWGSDGLQLNIIRGEIMYTYPFDKSTGTVTIKPAGTDVTTDVNSAAYQALNADQKAQLAQLWILKKVKERYQVPLMFASAWTPPLYMKTNTSQVSAKNFNGLNFNCCSTDFANYIAGFTQAYQTEGINFYGVSPANEPENVFSDWASSYWDATHLGQFITNNLRPALNSKGLSGVKIIASENAAWGTANNFLSSMDKSNVDILAGHGYVEIGDLILGKRGLNQSQVTWNYATGNRPVWMTEASDDSGTYDNTMTGGLKLATNMHKFLAECNVNAYVYWLGMLAIRNNESLICTNSDGTLDYPKMYDVMGQYSRFVHQGYYHFNAALASNSTLKVSAYKDPVSGKFSVVVINPGANETHSRINLSGFTASGNLSSYLTSDASSTHWQSATIAPQSNGSFVVVVPPYSVVTFTGTAG